MSTDSGSKGQFQTKGDEESAKWSSIAIVDPRIDLCTSDHLNVDSASRHIAVETTSTDQLHPFFKIHRR